MFLKMFTWSSLVLLTGAALIVTPSRSQAQHGGGHGGGHAGGGHVGGGQFGGARFGGYHGGYERGGHHSYSRYGLGLYGYPYYDYSPYYYDYSPYYYSTDPYAGSGASYDSGYAGSGASSYTAPSVAGDSHPYYTAPSVASDNYPYADPRLQPDLKDSGAYRAVTPMYPYGYSSSPSAAASNTAPVQSSIARLSVRVPRDAAVWFEGSETTSMGPIREFQSPPLTPESRYVYDIRARWNDNGHETTQTQNVEVAAGGHVTVNFPIPPKNAEQASAVDEK